MTTPRGPERWRWVAHPPWRPPLPVRRPPPPRHRFGPAWGDRTPGYPATPRWGLPPVVLTPTPADPPRSRRWAPRLAAAAPGVLRSVRTWMVVSAVVHCLRYVVLAWFADRVAPWWVEATSSALVLVFGLLALLGGVAAAITAVAWLVETRRAAFAPGPDPRRRTELWAGSLLPVVNTVRLPVYLEELRRAAVEAGHPAATRPALRRWWAVWTLDVVLVAVALWRGAADGPQAAADAVLLSALAAAAAAWAVHETRVVMRSFGDSSPRFTRRLLVRGILGSSAAREERP